LVFLAYLYWLGCGLKQKNRREND